MSLKHKQLTGFTIVELLIVIVVIGILAAITIVAYNGIQDRARVATIQADLSQATKQLETSKLTSTSETYPANLAAANLKVSAGTSLSYDYDAGSNSYCLVATKATTIYHVTSTNSKPQSGGCITTNLALNPSLHTDATHWALHVSLTGGRIQDSGNWVFRGTRNAGGATAIYINQATPIVTTVGSQYTTSINVTSSVAQQLRIIIRRSAGGTDMIQATHTVQANTPTRISATGVSDSSNGYVTIHSASGVAGDIITLDELMVTNSTSVYNYADGNSPGWSWNGTANNSTSTGPAV